MIETLIVDDEENIRSFISDTLARVGHITTCAQNGEEALDILRTRKFDLAVLDLNLGGRADGLRVLEAIRWRWPETAAVILTGHGSLQSAMEAIREGVDVYLLKPVEPQELRKAAQEALDKRSQYFQAKIEEQEKPVLEIGTVLIDRDKMLVKVEGQEVNLTPREFNLLDYLMGNAHRVVPPKELSKVVGGFTPESEYEARQYIKWYIHELRKKIENDPSQPNLIINVREGGYRFRPPEA